MHDMILEYIDNIDTSTVVAECNVIGAMASLYEKEALIMEYCTNTDSEWYQEGIMDTIKKKEANDPNKLVSMLKLIPRLLMSIASAIANGIKRSKLAQSISVAVKKAKGLKDKEAKQAYCDELNAHSNGEYTAYVDKKGEICFRKGKTNLILDVIAIVGVIESAVKVKSCVDDIVKTATANVATLKELEEMTDLMAAVCKPKGSTNKNSQYASTNMVLLKNDVKMEMLENLPAAADSLVGNITNISNTFTEFLDSEAYKLQLKGLNDTTKSKVTKSAANITRNLSDVLSIVSAGLGSVKKITKTLAKIGNKANEKTRQVSLVVAQRVMTTFYKNPEDPNNPEDGLTRDGLEKLYPRSKSEDVNNYNARIDMIMYDIGDAFISNIRKDKDRDSKLVDRAYELDDKVVALRRKPEESKEVFIKFPITIKDKNGKDVHYAANGYAPYMVVARNIDKVEAKNAKEKRAILKNADAENQAAIAASNNAIVEKEINRRRELAADVKADDEKKKS